MTEIFHYPDDLEALVVSQWPSDVPVDPLAEWRRAVLEVAYHASMLTEEGRPVRVRLALAREADVQLEPEGGVGPLVLRLDRSRPLDVDEIRRIALASPFETAALLVQPDPSSHELRIWGMVSTGAQWLAPSRGGRSRLEIPLPGTVVHVRGPARIAVYAGDRFVAALEGGRLATLRTDVFASSWMPELFRALRAELEQDRETAIASGTAPLEVSIAESVSQQMLRRALWLMREGAHGGTLLFVEPAEADALFSGVLRAKYRLSPGAPRTRYRALLRALARAITHAEHESEDVFGRASQLVDMETAIFELSRTIASLSSIDGAIVLTTRFEVLAFGVEIVTPGEDRGMVHVHRALDAEGDQTVDDDEENVGTRHRAAYRFVQSCPRGMAIVVSQDGTIRFVVSRAGRVTYYEQHVSG